MSELLFSQLTQFEYNIFLNILAPVLKLDIIIERKI